MKKSGFTTAVILIVAVLTLLVGAYLYWQRDKATPLTPAPTPTPTLSPIPPTPAPTANPKLTDISTWSACVNRELGFSIKYPPDWYRGENLQDQCVFSYAADSEFLHGANSFIGGRPYRTSRSEFGAESEDLSLTTVVGVELLRDFNGELEKKLGSPVQLFDTLFQASPGRQHTYDPWYDWNPASVNKIASGSTESLKTVVVVVESKYRSPVGQRLISDGQKVYAVSTTIPQSDKYYPIAKQILDSFQLLD